MGELRRNLTSGSDEDRAYWLGALMREANSRDVWLYTSPARIRAMWTLLWRHLGKSRSMWAYLLDLPSPPTASHVANLAVRQEKCSSYNACRAGSDAIYMGNGAHHIWLDHLDVADGQDGNCDITKAADYITVSWSKFHYTYKKEHAFSNLIAGSNSEFQSRGKLQITYMNCWWGENVDQRSPMGRFGKIHLLNNYHSNNGTYIHEINAELSLIAEHCYYDVPNKTVFRGNHGPTGFKGIGNEGVSEGLNESFGSVFEIPYTYTAMTATEAKAAVTSPKGGAGNTVQLVQ